MKMDNQEEVIHNQNNKKLQDKKSTNMLLAAFVMFIFPIIAITLGAYLGACIGEATNSSATIFQIIGGLLGVIIAGIGIKLFDKASKVDGKAEKIYWDDL
ncbi:SoxR reducing system RseC family protein [Clostridium saccharoperbutylacetonicum]|uniref:SoxR reducing system RseC family protein n=1 Tax=Clostridium saccharoperbutylacetonicum TaxID=36745 RepID=UPI0039ED218C